MQKIFGRFKEALNMISFFSTFDYLDLSKIVRNLDRLYLNNAPDISFHLFDCCNKFESESFPFSDFLSSHQFGIKNPVLLIFGGILEDSANPLTSLNSNYKKIFLGKISVFGNDDLE